MKKMLCSILVMLGIIYSANYTVDGYAFLEGETDHSGIEVVFRRTAPDTLYKDTVFTGSSGYYSSVVEEGWYDVKYDKGYWFFPEFINDLNCYSDQTITDITLAARTSLSGEIYGILPAGDYEVTDELIIADGDSLIIEPGATLKFHSGTRLLVNGTLHAFGTEIDSIKFTSMTGSDWNGIKMDYPDHPCYFSYCVINNSVQRGINGPNINISNSHIHNNYSVYDPGAGIYCWYSVISDCLIEDNDYNHGSNTIDFPGGGGIYCLSDTKIENCIIRNNISSRFGGGIAFRGTDIFIQNCKIEGNTGGDGGGIASASQTTGYVEGCILRNNTSSDRGGGIYHNSYGELNYVNNIIADNTSSSDKGGGLYYFSSASNDIMNSIFYNNEGNGVYCHNPDYGPSLEYSCLFGNSPANFSNCGSYYGVEVTVNANGDSCDSFYNIIMDPIFKNITNKEFTLHSDSPCIDAGINSIEGYTFPDLDPYGNTRLIDGDNNTTIIVDMGLYEYSGLGEPLNLVLALSASDASISWDTHPDADSYSVYSSTDPYAVFPSAWTVEASGLTVTNWTDTNVTDSKKFYIVTGVNSN